MATNLPIIGTVSLPSTKDANTKLHTVNVVYASSTEATDKTITIGTRRLGLRKLTDGNYCLGVVLVAGTSENDKTLEFYQKIYELKKKNNVSILKVIDTGGSDTRDNSFVWMMTNLSVNADRDLIVAKITDTVDEYSTLSIGDRKLQIAKVADIWYLCVSE